MSTRAERRAAQRKGRSIRKTPLVMTGIFLEILRGFFRTGSEQFRWDESEIDSKLIIEPIHKLDFEVVQARPTVYVARGAYQYEVGNRLAMNDQIGGNPITGEKVLSVLVTCAMQLVPVGRRSAEIERLAEEVSESMMVFKELLREDYGFLRFDIAGIAPVGIVQESREHFTAPVTVRTQFQESWSITPIAPKVKNICVDIQTGIANMISCTAGKNPSYSSPGDFSDPCDRDPFCELPPKDLHGVDDELTDTELGDGYGVGPYS